MVVARGVCAAMSGLNGGVARSAMLVLVGVVAMLAQAGVGQGSLRVTLPDGSPLEGRRYVTSQAFLGIPFAKPPVGALRFKAPTPNAPWTALREAKEFAPDCLSTSGNYIEFNAVSEDCLYLNVYRPDNATADSKLPVMLFLYGGSWKYGGSSFFMYDGEHLVNQGNVIVVTSNYRLGLFGFLGSSVLQRQSSDGATGNYGMQDQRMAMQWVQRNIAAFGGDTRRVMLFGESAGAGSVTAHLVMPRSKGLFSRAGIESGPPADWSALPLSVAETTFDSFVKDCACDKGSDAGTLDCIQALTPNQVLHKCKNSSDTAGRLGGELVDYAPVIDGVELTADPQALWAAGEINPVEGLLIGTNTNEGTEFVHLAHTATPEDLDAFFFDMLGPRLGNESLALYNTSGYSDAFQAGAMMFTDAYMACPSARAAGWMTAAKAPVYLYHYEHPLEVLHIVDPVLGVMHAIEIPLVFHFEVLLTPAERRLSHQVMAYWTNFARSANPNAGGAKGIELPAWPVWDASGSYQILNVDIKSETNLKPAECALWDRVYHANCSLRDCPCDCNI